MAKKKVTAELISGNQKKDPTKTWEGIRIEIGSYKHVFFARSSYEMDRIKKELEELEDAE